MSQTTCCVFHADPFLCSDNLILRLAKAAGEVLGKTHDELMYAFGVYMVKRIGNYGYERILKVICSTTLQTISLTSNCNYFLLRVRFPLVKFSDN